MYSKISHPKKWFDHNTGAGKADCFPAQENCENLPSTYRSLRDSTSGLDVSWRPAEWVYSKFCDT